MFENGAGLIETPSGRFLLLNGGASPTALVHELGRRLPLFRREVDWLVVSETSEGQIRGLVGLTGRIRIRDAWLPDGEGTPGFEHLVAELAEAEISPVLARTGQALDLGDDIRLEVLFTTERTILLRLVYGNAIVVFVPGEESLLATPWLRSGTVTAWILSDDSSLVSLPLTGSPVVILPGQRRMEAPPGSIQVLPQSELGWVELATDGVRLWGWSERRAGG